jgi:hypothetical protein
VRRGLLSGGVLLALVCAVALAATASAKPVKRPQPVPYPPNSFELEGTNGFTIDGSMYLSEAYSGRGAFSVTAIRGHESVTYAVPARVTANSVRADLGRLGRVDLTLHPSGGETTAKLDCSKESVAYEPATFEGIFEFHGEGGFTRATATTMAAVPSFGLPRSTCGTSLGEALGDRRLPGARLRAVSFAGGRTLRFQLNKNWPMGKTLYTATIDERRGGMRVHRELSGTAPAGAFRFDRRLRTATISPPAPFSGTARVTRSRNSLSPLFGGDLKLAFPGRTVELDGPAVHVSLEPARQTRGEGGNVSVGF